VDRLLVAMLPRNRASDAERTTFLNEYTSIQRRYLEKSPLLVYTL
jgi:hypothetical protein